MMDAPTKFARCFAWPVRAGQIAGNS